ncbi:helicase subunit [Escherichia coli]
MRIFQIMKKGCKFINGNQWIVVRGIETDKHNVLQEEDRGVGKCMINRILWPVMN